MLHMRTIYYFHTNVDLLGVVVELLRLTMMTGKMTDIVYVYLVLNKF